MVYQSMFDETYNSSAANKKVCPICNKETNVFMPAGEIPRKNALCPNCGSLERHRTYYLFFESNTDLFYEHTSTQHNTIRVLHFAPEPVFYKKFSGSPNIDYYPVDYYSA